MCSGGGGGGSLGVVRSLIHRNRKFSEYASHLKEMNLNFAYTGLNQS